MSLTKVTQSMTDGLVRASSAPNQSVAGSKTSAQYSVSKVKVTFASSDVFDAGFINAIFAG